MEKKEMMTIGQIVKTQPVVIIMLIIKPKVYNVELLDVIPKNILCCNFILLSPNKYLCNRSTLISMFLVTAHIFYFVKVGDTLQLFLFLPHLDSFYLSVQTWDEFLA